MASAEGILDSHSRFLQVQKLAPSTTEGQLIYASVTWDSVLPFNYHFSTAFWEDLTRHRLTRESNAPEMPTFSSDPQCTSQSQLWCCQVSMETGSVIWTCCEDRVVITMYQHYLLHDFHSEFSNSAVEEVVVVLSQSNLHLTQHLVVISLMSRVSTRFGLDFMQVKAWREQGALCWL